MLLPLVLLIVSHKTDSGNTSMKSLGPSLSVVVDTVYVCPLLKSLVTRWDGEIKVLALVAIAREEVGSSGVQLVTILVEGIEDSVMMQETFCYLQKSEFMVHTSLNTYSHILTSTYITCTWGLITPTRNNTFKDPSSKPAAASVPSGERAQERAHGERGATKDFNIASPLLVFHTYTQQEDCILTQRTTWSQVVTRLTTITTITTNN